MNAVYALLALQIVLGAFDNFWHHELHAKLPQRASARHELTLHAARECLYGILFLALAWSEWHGATVLALVGLLVTELGITIADFLEEDRSRRLPPLERALHTVLAVGFGLLAATLAPVFMGWGRLPSGIVPADHGLASWLLSAAAAGVLAWSVRNALAVIGMPAAGAAQRTAAPADRRAAAPRHPLVAPPTVLVTGATGFIGTALVAAMVPIGWRVIALSRDPLQARQTFPAGVRVVDSLDDIVSETRIDAVVNLAGAPVLGFPWTARRRRQLIESRTTVTAAVIVLMRRLIDKPRVLVSASAVGYYGVPQPSQHGTASSVAVCDESSPPQPGRFQSDLCIAVEHEAGRAEAIGVRVVNLRFGIVLGAGGGAFPALSFAARMGCGAVLGSGRQPMPWIHLDDAVGLVQFVIANDHLRGPVNAVAPGGCTQEEFARATAASWGRGVWMRVPGALLSSMLGEMSELLLEGQTAVPALAMESGYVFRFATLAIALAAIRRGMDGGQTILLGRRAD